MPTTKKDYIKIAGMLAQLELTGETEYLRGARDMHRWISLSLADVFEAENPYFNRDKFLQATKSHRRD